MAGKNIRSTAGKKGVGMSAPGRPKNKVATVMHEFKAGTLHSGSDKGPVVKNRDQAIAIGLSEQRKGKK